MGVAVLAGRECALQKDEETTTKTGVSQSQFACLRACCLLACLLAWVPTYLLGCLPACLLLLAACLLACLLASLLACCGCRRRGRGRQALYGDKGLLLSPELICLR